MFWRKLSALDEFSESPALRLYGSALAITHLLTAWFWRGGRGLPETLASMPPICWPFFPDCDLSRGALLPLIDAAFTVYPFIALGAVLLWPFFRTWKWGWGLLLLATLVKFFLFAQDYRTMGNYHYMPFIVTALFLFVPGRIQVIPLSLVSFYVGAGVLKFDAEWLTGAALFRETWLQGAWLEFALAFVVLLEMVGAWFLLATRRVVGAIALGAFAVFHLYSWHLVGFFYPTVMFSLLSYFPLVWLFNRPTLQLRDILSLRLHPTAWAFVVLFTAAQALPHLRSGDSAVTGDGRFFSLNMFDAYVQCQMDLSVVSDRHRVFLSGIRRDVGVRIACDPLTYLTEVRKACRWDEVQEGSSRVEWHMVGRRRSGPEDHLIVSEKNACETTKHYRMFGGNPWLRFTRLPSPGQPLRHEGQ